MTTSAPGTNRRSKLIMLASMVALMLSLLPFASAMAAGTLAPATGGETISADTNTTNGTVTWTTLSGPVFTLGAAADVTTGAMTFNAPSGFSFNTAATPTVGTGTTAADGSCAAPSSTAFTCTFTASSALGTVTFGQIQVRPTSGILPASGNITVSANTALTGVANGSNAGTLTEVPGAAILSFDAPGGQQPSATGTGGTDLTQQPIVRARDQFGNPRLAGDVVTLAFTAGTNTEGATLTCAPATNQVTTTIVGGEALATFAGCDINRPGTYTLTASTPGGSPATSGEITIAVGVADHLAFTSYPSNPSPTSLGTVAVAIQDAGGNTVSDTRTIALSINKNSGTFTCSGGLSKAAVAGIATFSSCSQTSVTTGYIITADDGLGGLLPVAGASFNVTSGTATKLVFTTQPTGAVSGGTTSGSAGVAWPTQPVVTIQDVNGATVSSDDTTVVTLSIAPSTPTSGGPGTLTCTGGLSKTAIDGVASFAGCSIDKPGGGYKLRATSSPSFTLATSNPFSILAGPATKLGFTAQPGASSSGTPFTIQPVVAVQDAGGNTVTTGTSSTATATLSIGTNPSGGTLTCTGGLSKAAVAGVATFSGCQIDKPGTGYTLVASATGLTSATSTAFTVTLPTATLTLSSSASITTYRQFVALTAQFSGTLGGSRMVSFQRMTSVVPGTWVTIGTATTNAAGRATFNYGPPYNTQFRVVFAGAADLATVTSNTIRVNVRHKVLLRPGAGTTTIVRQGTRITYTAVVRPIAPAGTQRITFLIYKKVGRVWTFRTSATVSTANGVATFSWRWSRGEWYVRARGNATIYNLAALSTLAKVTAR